MDERCIKKLLNITTNSIDYNNLKNTIEFIKSNKNLITKDVKKLIDTYQTNKGEIDSLLNKIL